MSHDRQHDNTPLTSIQKLEERASTCSGRDQAHPECASGHWTIHGSYRSEVCSLPSIQPSILTTPALASYNHQQARIMSSVSCLLSIANSSNHHPPSLSTGTQTLSSISYPRRLIPQSQCLVQTRNQMLHTQMLEDWICRSKRSEKQSSYQ